MTFLLIANSLSSVLNFRFDLIKAIQAKGYAVHVAAPEQDAAMQAKLEAAGVVYHQVNISRAGLNPVQDLKTLWQLYRLMRQVKPQKVLGYTIKPVVYGSLAAWLARVEGRYSLIAGLGYAFTDDGEKSLKRSLVNWVAKFLYRLALNRCDKVFFQNPDDEALFRKLGILKPATASQVVNGSGVNLNHFAPAPLPERPSFVLIARLLYDKGIREYAAAAKQLKAKYPHASFNLVGGLDENPKSVTQAELDEWSAGGYINYIGQVSDVRPALADASVMVLPSYREGTPRSVLEAMAMGRAVVTTDAPGCKETVRETAKGNNGFLVQPQSVESLIEAMEQLIINPELNKQMGEASLLLAKEVFDVNKVNAEMLAGMDL